MGTVNVRGVLIVGVPYGGSVHKDFCLRPQLVQDSVEVMESEHAERASKNDSFFGVCLLAKQIDKLGDIPREEITPALVMSLTEVDFQEIHKKKGELEQRLRSFRGEEKAPSRADPGAA